MWETLLTTKLYRPPVRPDWVSRPGLLHHLQRTLTCPLTLMDESAANASGCSIDKSVSFMTQLGHRYGFNTFDRWLFGIFDSQGELRILNRTELVSAVQQGHVHDDTWCLDNLVDNLNDLKSDWEKRFGDCWIKRVI